MELKPLNTPVDAPSDRKRGVGRLNAQRKWEIRQARVYARNFTMNNPRYRWRIQQALQNGTLHPMLERAFLEMGEFMPKNGKRDDLSERTMGLFNVLLRKALNVDPLAAAKPVEASIIIEHPEQEKPILEPRPSIIPPSRPRRQGTANLKPGEEELP